MATPDTVHARCLCGHLRFEARLPVKWVGHCHCENCRRAHGAGVWTYATFASDRVRPVTDGRWLGRYRTETGATRCFCTNCGSTLSYESPVWPGWIDLSLANIDPPLDELPIKHNFADRSPDWCPILDDLPRLGGPNGDTPT